MMFKLVSASIITALIASVFSPSNAQTGPGGVGNGATNKIWLKASEGIVDPTPNSRVGYWADQSGNGFNAIQNIQGNRPSYKSDELNQSPSIHFDRSAAIQYFELTSVGIRDLITYSNTIFVVGKTNSGGADNGTNLYQSFVAIPGYHSGIGVFGHPQTTGLYMNNWVGVWHNGRPTRSIVVNAPYTQDTWSLFTRKMTQTTGVVETAYLNGTLLGTTSDALKLANYSQQLLRIGTAGISGPETWALNGDISEIIAYNKSLNEAERILVENYLSSKYGLVIENDKFSYDGLNQFRNNVAGIGRVNSSSTNLSATSDLLNISNPSLFGDNEFVLLGHNGFPIALNNQDSPVGMRRLDRVWRVDIAGDPGAVIISFKVDNFSPSAGNFQLLVDDDGQFSNATSYSGSLSNGVFTVTSPVSLTTGDYLTLAYDQSGPGAPLSLSYEVNRKMIIYGTSFSTTVPILVDGGAEATFSLVNPPNGVTINPVTGIISAGATLPGGVHALTVQATNTNGSTNFGSAYTFVVLPYAASKLTYPLKTISFNNAIDPIFPNLPLGAFQYSVASGSLNGLNFNAGTGEISGVLQSEETTTAIIRATPVSLNATGSALTFPVKLTALGATGPGGVGSVLSNRIWFDASEQNGLQSGAQVSSLLDRSGNQWNALQSSESRKPTYLVNQLNGKPVVRFDRSISIKCLDVISTGVASVLSNSNTSFVVAKANAGARNNTYPLQSLMTIPGLHSGLYFSGYPATTGVHFQNYLGGVVYGDTPSGTITTTASIAQGTWKLLSRNIIGNNGTAQLGYVNGLQMGSTATSGLPLTKYNNDLVRIGAADLTGTASLPLHGDMAELILYSASLNEAQRILAENYLSAKYNLPIENDKYVSHESTYIMDVQGIGTSDGTNSNKHSIAFNSKGLGLAEAHGSLNHTNEFLLAGHASASNLPVMSELPVSLTERWQRTWYLEKTGAIDVKLSFDISEAGLTAPGNLSTEFIHYHLLYRSATAETFAVIPIAPALENGDQISFTLNDAQLINGYYTIGYSQGIVWTGIQDENWTEPANWNLNRAPVSADHVIINTCTMCPRLNNSINVGALHLNDGSKINLDHYTLTVEGVSYLNESEVESNHGKLQSFDFGELKNSKFRGSVTLEKTGGSANVGYGGNVFSAEVKIVNSSDNPWQISAGANNVIQKF